jgi:hypothetical protein
MSREATESERMTAASFFADKKPALPKESLALRVLIDRCRFWGGDSQTESQACLLDAAKILEGTSPAAIYEECARIAEDGTTDGCNCRECVSYRGIAAAIRDRSRSTGKGDV